VAQLTDQQLANNAAYGGWSGNDRVIAVAVALAESGGKSDATHTNSNGSTDYGLWQVNSIHGFPAAELLTPTGNAKAAYSVWQKQGWKAWTTYKSGAYLPFMSRAMLVAPKAETGGGGSGDDVTKTSNPLEAAADAIRITARAGAWIADAHNWMRVLWVVVGGGLILAGLGVAARPLLDPAAKTAAAIAKAAA
jgi:hypothetical protein